MISIIITFFIWFIPASLKVFVGILAGILKVGILGLSWIVEFG